MAKNHSRLNKGPFNAVVSTNRQIGRRFYRLGLDFKGPGTKAFAKPKPGQFVELDLSNTTLPSIENIPQDLRDISDRKILLRRPFSFCDAAVKGNNTSVEILYCVVGPASLRMTALSKGGSVSVIGPLGNGFREPKDKKTALLIAGGIGAAPLLHLAATFTADFPKINVIAFAGAKTAKELPFERRLDEISQQLGFSLAEFAGYGIQSLVATDDGSAGFAGPVTDCLSEWLGSSELSGKDMIIYGCGPEAMLAKIAEIAEERKIDCQVSMERRMACGTGLCQSCAVECRLNGSSETIYKMCCTDGPVFDSKEVVFSS